MSAFHNRTRLISRIFAGLGPSRVPRWACWRPRWLGCSGLASPGLTPTLSVSSKPWFTKSNTGKRRVSESGIAFFNLYPIRLPYSQDQCGDLLSAQRLLSPDNLEDTDDIYPEEGDTPDSLEEQIYLVPENYEQDQEDFQPQPYIYNQEDIDDEGPTLIDEDYMPNLDQQEAWLHLQNVSNYFRFFKRQYFARLYT